MQHTLPKLQYQLNALEPHISQQTLEFHYGKHYQAYVDNLNKLIIGTEFANATLEEIIKKTEPAQADGEAGKGVIFNNAAQVFNHTFYFESLSPEGGLIPNAGEISGEILEAINKNFESLDNFKTEFIESAKTLFGSGWVWLVKKEDGSLKIIQTKNAENPLQQNAQPLLTIDVWEHAYYLDYKNKRPDYIEAFFNIINWQKVNERLI